MIPELSIEGVGPADALHVEFSPRLNLVTGDNGLGKSFLLDLAWFALTGTWAREPARPQRGLSQPAWISWGAGRATYQRKTLSWHADKRHSGVTAPLMLYARVDEGFSVFDPRRNALPLRERSDLVDDAIGLPSMFQFERDDIWNGLTGADGERHCNGLISDWASWQQSNSSTFTRLRQVLARLSPAPDHLLEPGELTRISLKDVRDHPTLRMPFGQDVALIHASAALRRIVSFAYMLVWAWHEHLAAARLREVKPTGRIVFLIDEIEAHLHPQWQRRILPALLDVMTALTGDVGPHIQLIAVTHAPLVLASAEPFFDSERDALLHFDLTNGRVALHRQPWAKQGDIVNWLVSHVFGLDEARSLEAERAVEAARAWMAGTRKGLPPGLDTADAIDAELRRVLAGHDDFWPEWLVATKQVSGTRP